MTIVPLLPEIDFGLDPLENLYGVVADLRAQGHRVVPVRYINGTAWLLLDYDDVAAAYADEQNLPAAPAYLRHSVPSQGMTLLAMQGNAHRINRALVAGAFQPAAIRRLAEALLVPVANRLIDGFAGESTLDLVPRFTHAYPFAVISEMIGIPEADHAWFMAQIERLFRYPWEPEQALAARREVTSHLQPLLDQRRRDPQDDLLSMLATAQVEGQVLTDEEIFSFIRLLYPAGAETTYLTMGSMLWEVLSDPDIPQELANNPAKRAAAVEEALRKHGGVAFQPRYTENEVVIAGVAIPAQSWLLFGNGPAGHDPKVFPDPEAFRLDRGQNRHVAFGKGPHFCLGSHLAREELRIALHLLLERLPGLRLVAATPPTGAVLRGVTSLEICFDAVLPAPIYDTGSMRRTAP